MSPLRESDIVGNQIEAIGVKKGLRIGIVRALFRSALTERMQTLVQQRAARFDAKITRERLARGALETPLLAQELLQRKDIDGVVVLGVVIQGTTAHDDVVVRSATDALVRTSLEVGKPVGIGIIGPGVTLEQAHERVEEYAQGALDAVLLGCQQLRKK
ncbi:6,7-dimethyl-8-ribityllumazine synthase [Candidatus Micrarchaeota archaeon]|nr:6,7-dimethyl-8-ribityllumazine synthase [Candidatus Micrarchaeota archaeon]